MGEIYCSIIDFISRNEGELVGSFLGAFLAALVAYYSARKGHLYSVQRNKEELDRKRIEQENKYCSLLHSIIVELSWHKDINSMVLSQVEGIREKSKVAGKMIIDEPTTFIKIDFLRKLRDTFPEFEFSNHVIPTHLQLYINKAEIINRSLKLNVIDETVKRFDEPENFAKAVDLYFNQLVKDFQTLEEALSLNLKFSLEEVNKYPNAEVHKYYNHLEKTEEELKPHLPRVELNNKLKTKK
ncbi:MAG TPA: hypothetical protein DCL80_09500 [Balneola sp.]|jgi:hypothetical protein|nr:hypothetical protein [Balneola sp.]MAO77959.1 hypothetical protein [Balneola sp.]MBF65250.1 hypothetical protein [Balneola sp.]HAH51474.1 hypothetical protein [Balneola sp.]HBZ40097.1 hypothetical protein [Balneola sp.]